MHRVPKYQHFVGFDVSRNKLDCTLSCGSRQLFHKVIENNPPSITDFINELKEIDSFKLRTTVFGMEQTGIYTAHLLNILKAKKANIVVEDPLHIKNSLGKSRGKYDKLDSIRIAKYLYKFQGDYKFWIDRRPIINELQNLAALRGRLLTHYKALQMPLKEQKDFWNQMLFNQHVNICSNTLEAIKNDIAKVEQLINDLIVSDSGAQRLYEIITSIPNAGPVLAVQMIIATNEFIDITDPKKFASYAGIAPFRNESGIIKGKAKVSHIANKKLKALLHICAMSSIAHKSELKDYYLRKTQTEGKAKMAVLNAIRNKIVLRIFACVRQNRLYQKDYTRDGLMCS